MDLEKLKEQFAIELEKVSDEKSLNDLEIRFLGRKGELTNILRGISELSLVEKKRLGVQANELKEKISLEVAKKKEEIDRKQWGKIAESEYQDINDQNLQPTTYNLQPNSGHLHPLSNFIFKIERVFEEMGYCVVEGNEIATDFFNFEALNFKPDHPARDSQDTFLIRQINADKDADQRGLLYEDLTYRIRGVVFDVYNKLGPGHKESVYQKALEIGFEKAKLSFEKEKSLKIKYGSEEVGTYRPDFIIENKAIIEIKALQLLGGLEKKQVWSYLRGSSYRLALLINFGAKEIEIERIIYDSVRDDQREDPHESALLLRTQTSTYQVPYMLEHKDNLPIKIIVPGKTYRRDDDVSHSPMFHQFEGLVVDKGISLSDLKGTLSQAMKKLLGADTNVRFRTNYFPFVEPGLEVDVTCTICRGKGCRVCKQTGWVELLGAGMVHPNVLKNGGIDPEEYSGFAFGTGIERLTMMHHAIPDIDYLFDNDLRFLEQF